MIYPTRAAVLIAAAGALATLLVDAVAPAYWYVGLAWPAAVLLLCLVDAATGARRLSARLELPRSAYVGHASEAIVRVGVTKGPSPRLVEVALDLPPIVHAEDDGRMLIGIAAEQGSGRLELELVRRGIARFASLWLRWKGPLGLMWHQEKVALDAGFPVLPDLRPVHRHGAAIFQRHALQGLVAQLERGDGSDLDALVEYQQGMDRRAIDWKQSARHSKLLARQYRSERNNQIVFAIDSGRQMSEPIAGLPRVDRAVSAMLLTAWVALKMGDRIALHSFDSRPRVGSGLVSGMGAFAELQQMAAGIDYSGEETNYTFALTGLASRLTRRSMIVLFTEFTDSISADFMVRAARRLVQTHLLLVVVLRDEELESIVEREPDEADDITRTITAADLLKERRIAIGRLQHLGVHVIESEHDKVGESLVHGYLDLKRRNLL
ncbi:DUF58 domain-containing protein [Sphingomonas arenae]|uniref:DUF58 domain-containing protein n=1 Tax=Sphingomonas arenae TaxID=2812555 RepID=UPI001967B6FE|nr:DUF58 domain-containing protein [Sphingomonas arenae]